MNWLRGRVVPNGDVGFVVRELNVKYLQPVHLADDFVVETKMTDVGSAIVRVEQKFVKDGVEYAIINIKVAYLGGDMRPKRIPEEFVKGLV